LVARISYFNDKVQFTLPTAFKYSGTGAVMPMTLTNRVPRIDAKLGHGDPVALTVDTGSDGALVLYRSYADTHAADFKIMSLGNTDQIYAGVTKGANPDLIAVSKTTSDSTSARGAGGGEIPIRLATISRMDLGQFSIFDLFTQVVLRSTGAFAPTQSDGILGAGTLAKFNAVFVDYPGKRIILEK
jgi:hypothetical protein